MYARNDTRLSDRIDLRGIVCGYPLSTAIDARDRAPSLRMGSTSSIIERMSSHRTLTRRSLPLLASVAVLIFTAAHAEDGIDNPASFYRSASGVASPGSPCVFKRDANPSTGADARVVVADRADCLLQKVERAGSLRVIVGINYPELPPTASAGDIERYTAGLRAAQDEALHRAGANPSVPVSRFSLVPAFTVTADAALMKNLLANPNVISIEEDAVGSVF